MVVQIDNEAFNTLVTQAAGEAQRIDLLGMADAFGASSIIDGPLEQLPYIALTPDIAGRAPADLAAERARRQKSMERALADISLWDVAI